MPRDANTRTVLARWEGLERNASARHIVDAAGRAEESACIWRSARNDATLATKRDYAERVARTTGEGTRGAFDHTDRTRASVFLSDVDADALGVVWRAPGLRLTDRTRVRGGDDVGR